MTRTGIRGRPPPKNEAARSSRGGEANPERFGNSNNRFLTPTGPAGQWHDRARPIRADRRWRAAEWRRGIRKLLRDGGERHLPEMHAALRPRPDGPRIKAPQNRSGGTCARSMVGTCIQGAGDDPRRVRRPTQCLNLPASCFRCARKRCSAPAECAIRHHQTSLPCPNRWAYAAILSWHDKALGDRFSQAVVDLVRSEYPNDMSGGAA